MAKQYGKTMTIWFGTKPTIFVSDYRSAWEVLVTKATDFGARSMPYKSRTISAEWRTISTCDYSEACFEEEAAENDGVVNPLPRIRKDVVRLIGRLCFGPDFRDEEFVETMDVIIEDTFSKPGLEDRLATSLEVVIFSLFEMFLLAVDSTSLTIAWALAFLIHDQHIQDKLYKELISQEYYGKEGALGMEQVNKMKYLQGMVKESTRMRPIAPLGIPHKAVNDTSLMGKGIEAGTTVMVNLYAVLHYPAVWKEPDRFDPERFLENAGGRPQGKLVDDEEKDHAAMTGAMERCFLPFGAGWRIWNTTASEGKIPDVNGDLTFLLGMKTPLLAKIVPRHT
ncbi:hypothetical protein H6P81_010388 [Aristolochia fimbriata]|uniref:Cytochrome P450 n=1 Tax=Aristolochia fimbriata TaxID=158543 RepID=A0AAV7ET35_ARIFI|nr:hypothetical protein H6P81_010388 [Aristolochia fimbriata]